MSINNFFILASESKSRILILKNLGLNFRKKKHNINEKSYKKIFIGLKYPPKKISLQLAKSKAKNIKIKNRIIVGSDTVIDFKGKTIEKARSLLGAEKKIRKLSGKKHTIISSAAAYYNQQLIWCCTQQASVKLRKLKDSEIKKYLNVCGPDIIDSVGCYKVEKNGAIIIEKINGDFFTVMGFPLFPFLDFLKKFNIKK